MERKKKTAIIINVLTIVLNIYALAIRPDRYGIPAVAFYTVLSNVLAMFSSIVYLADAFSGRKISFLTTLRYSACCSLVLTFLVVVLYLVWFTDPLVVLFEKNNVFHHILIPLMTFYSYICCERHTSDSKCIKFPMLYSMVYAVILIILNAKGIVNGPYPFFMTESFGLVRVILMCSGLFVIVWVLFRSIYQFALWTEGKQKNG